MVRTELYIFLTFQSYFSTLVHQSGENGAFAWGAFQSGKYFCRLLSSTREINSLRFGSELALNIGEWQLCKAQGAKVVPL
jgi:hypothetical protein